MSLCGIHFDDWSNINGYWLLDPSGGTVTLPASKIKGKYVAICAGTTTTTAAPTTTVSETAATETTATDTTAATNTWATQSGEGSGAAATTETTTTTEASEPDDESFASQKFSSTGVLAFLSVKALMLVSLFGMV